MAQRLTELLNAHHDKLNEHTSQLKQIEAQLAALDATVGRLEQQVVSELDNKSDDETNSLRAGLRDWLAHIRELL